MKFRVSSELSYNIKAPTSFIFNIQVAQTKAQTILEEKIITTPADLPVDEFSISSKNARFLRMHVPRTDNFRIQYTATVNLTLKPVQIRKTAVLKIEQISEEALPFLYPSRYCQSDKLYNFAEVEFGHIKSTYGKVKAICDWIYENVSYVCGSTNANTSCLDTIFQRQGVCRDFSHLGIALCRALTIPARYFAGYANQLNPPDFHACFEAYIDGRWIFFDATRMIPQHGLIKIAHGHDAADTSFASIYGEADPIDVIVNCEALDKKAFDTYTKKLKLVSYE